MIFSEIGMPLEGVDQKDDSMTREEIARMREALPSLHVEEGLTYSMHSRSLYLDILRDYADEDQETALEQHLAQGDLKGYEVVIHALKSTSRLVGLKELGDLAEALQFAAGKGDGAFVREHHPGFLAQYLDTKEKLRRLIE